MKKVALFIICMLCIFGLGTNLLAYEGGTKLVAAMTHPERGEGEAGTLLVIPHDQLAPEKPFLGLLRRVPSPTLSAERIRTEGRDTSLGTKTVVRFQKEGKI